MSVYCMADIHGEIERYKAMLELINFSDDDTLYIIGDIIDRNPGGIDILMDIMDRPNVKVILGNHEQLLLDTLGPNNVYGARQLWQENGGSCTRRELLYHRTIEERNKIVHYLMGLPDCLDIELNGRKYHLVHGYPGDNHRDRIWKRPKMFELAPFEDKIAIIGHTPTVFLMDYQEEEKPFRIYHGRGFIDIDCGCGNETEFRCLACLRLDDMKEFYV